MANTGGRSGIMKAMLLMGHGGPEMLRTMARRRDPTAGTRRGGGRHSRGIRNGADPKVRRGHDALLALVPVGEGADTSPRRLRHLGYVLEARCHAWAATSPASSARSAPAVTDVQSRRRRVRRDRPRHRRRLCGRKSPSRRPSSAKKPALDRPCRGCGARRSCSLTAMTAIEDTAHLKKGETILIQGGAGGVAGFAVAACQASRRDRDHGSERRQPRLRARSRRRPRHRLQHRRLHRYRPRFATWCSTPLAAASAPVATRCSNPAAGWCGSRLRPRALRRTVRMSKPCVPTSNATAPTSIACWRCSRPARCGAPAIHRYKLADAAEAHRVSEGRHLRAN